MSSPWHIPLKCAAELKPKPKAPQPSFIKHYCNIDVFASPVNEVKVGLMFEINQITKEIVTIHKFISAGMTIAILNINDLEPNVCSQMVQSIRNAVYNYSSELDSAYPLAIMIEIRNPDILTGNLKSGPDTTIELIENKVVKITVDPGYRECGTADCLYVSWNRLPDLKNGDELVIDSLTSAKVRIHVNGVAEDTLRCTVIKGGIIGERMPVKIISKESRTLDLDNLDDISCKSKSEVGFDTIDDKIAWAVASDIDAVLIPNCEDLSEIRRIRNSLGSKGEKILVFSSIETTSGLDNLDEILKESDGIFLNRSKLSMDLYVEKIFVAQKKIFAKCNKAGKPVICKAVLNEQVPAHCVTDIANLVIDGADVLYFEIQYETPFKNISLLYDNIQNAENCMIAAGVVCSHAERILWQPKAYGSVETMQNDFEEPLDVISISAFELAMRVQAVLIICVSKTGRTAKSLSREYPISPIVAVTRDCQVARQLRFWRGVKPLHYFEQEQDDYVTEVKHCIHIALDYSKTKGIIRAGDAYLVISASTPSSAHCDSIRLLYASDRETLIID